MIFKVNKDFPANNADYEPSVKHLLLEFCYEVPANRSVQAGYLAGILLTLSSVSTDIHDPQPDPLLLTFH